MNRLLFLTVLFGACLLSVNAGVDGDDGGDSADGGQLTGETAADIDAGLDLNVDLNAGGLGEAGSNIVTGLSNTLTGVGQGLISGGAALGKGGTNFVQAIIDFLKRIIEALVGAILGMLNAITEQIDKAERALFDQVGIKRIGGFKNVVGKLGTALRDTTMGVVGGLGKIGSGLVKTLKGEVDVNADVDADVDAGVDLGLGDSPLTSSIE